MSAVFNWEDIVVPEEEVRAYSQGPIAEKLIDLGYLARPGSSAEQKRPVKRFYKIVVSEDELEEVARLGTRSMLCLYLLIVAQTLLTKNATITLPIKCIRQWRLARYTVSDGLKTLEAAGIISVIRESGKSAKITLLAKGGAVSPPS